MLSKLARRERHMKRWDAGNRRKLDGPAPDPVKALETVLRGFPEPRTLDTS
jgi:hypothetical protein